MTRTPGDYDWTGPNRKNAPREKQPWEKAVDLGLEIESLIEDDVPEEALEEHGEFFESVRGSVGEVVATIERTQRVTEKQQKALDGWHRGVSAWIK